MLLNGKGWKKYAFFSAVQPTDFNTLYTIVIFNNEGRYVYSRIYEQVKNGWNLIWIQ